MNNSDGTPEPFPTHICSDKRLNALDQLRQFAVVWNWFLHKRRQRLVASDVTDLEFSRERSMVKISVRLTTAAGDSYVYIIPVGVGVH